MSSEKQKLTMVMRLGVELTEVKACSGTHFDPEMVETFFSCIETIQS